MTEQRRDQAFIDQPSLFDQGEQSKRENFQAAQPRMPDQRRRVLAAIRRHGPRGATREEIADELQLKVTSVCARVNELKNAVPPRVRDTNARRKTRDGSAAVIVALEN